MRVALCFFLLLLGLTAYYAGPTADYVTARYLSRVIPDQDVALILMESGVPPPLILMRPTQNNTSSTLPPP